MSHLELLFWEDPMLRRFLLISSLLVLPKLTFAAAKRVAIIGAGPAGIKAAALFSEKMKNGAHYEVKVFEKTKRVGGKIDTLQYPGQSLVEHGPIQVGIAFKYVNREIEKLGLKTYEPHPEYVLVPDPESPNGFKRVLPKNYYFNSGFWNIWGETSRLNKQLAELLKAKCIADIPKDTPFTENFEDFCVRHKVPSYAEMYRIYMSSYGYGQLKDLPAFLPLYNLQTSFGIAAMTYTGLNLKMLKTGFSGLMDAMIEHYRLESWILRGRIITQIDRDSSGVDIHYNDDEGSHQEHFDELIIACPIDKIYNVLANPTAEETSLYENIYYTPYHVVIAQVPELPDGGYVLAKEELNKYGHLQLISKNSQEGDLTVLYVPKTAPTRGKDLLENPALAGNMEETLVTLADDLKRYGMTLGEVFGTRIWSQYFPHYKKPEFYTAIRDIQGRNHTHYIGTMNQPADYVEKAFESAVTVIEPAFPGAVSPQTVEGLRAMLRWHNRTELVNGHL